MICRKIQITVKNKTRPDIQMNFYEVMGTAVLTYASETWSLTGNEKRLMQIAEMKFLKRVKGHRITDRKHNEDSGSELNILSVNNRIEERKR